MNNVGIKRDKFVQLAEKRVTRAIECIRLIGNLSNKSNYQYEEEDIRQIYAALRSELDNLKTKFSSKNGSAKVQFKLKA